VGRRTYSQDRRTDKARNAAYWQILYKRSHLLLGQPHNKTE